MDCKEDYKVTRDKHKKSKAVDKFQQLINFWIDLWAKKNGRKSSAGNANKGVRFSNALRVSNSDFSSRYVKGCWFILNKTSFSILALVM